MENKEQDKKDAPIRLDPEKFGVPSSSSDPMGMYRATFNMYDKMGQPNESRSRFAVYLTIFFSLILLVLPGAVYLIFTLPTFVSGTGGERFSAIMGVIFGLLFLGAGTRLMYSNIRFLIKK